MKTDEMTDDEMRVKIAELCGWKHEFFPEDTEDELSECWVWQHPNGTWVQDSFLPDYLNDLNAMDEAEKTLSYELADVYEDHLYDLVHRENENRDNPFPTGFARVSANARQRAIAFLKTKLA